MALFVSDEVAKSVSHFDPPDRVVRTVVRACATTNASSIIDQHLPFGHVAVDRASWAFDHTNGVFAVHASIGHHDVVLNGAVAEKSRVVIVSARASEHAVIASRTAIQIDQHRCRAVDKSILDQELHEIRIDLGRIQLRLSWQARRIRLACGVNVGTRSVQQQRFDQVGWHDND